MLFGGETGIGVHLGLTWWMLARTQACGKWGVSVWSQYRWVGVASNEVEVHCHSVEGVCVGPSVAVPRAVCRLWAIESTAYRRIAVLSHYGHTVCNSIIRKHSSPCPSLNILLKRGLGHGLASERKKVRF